MKVVVCKYWIWVSAMISGVLSGNGADAVKVAQVMAGELKEARVSWWGFDKTESTAFLQAAINSCVPRLIVDKMDAPWITDMLKCVSDQEIFFEPGVEVVAKKGSFTGRNDSLITLNRVKNVTLNGPGAILRMHRADYDAPPYIKAEWRHVINMRSSTNIKILGLTLAESGGDGIYLGCANSKDTNLDVLIRDVICDRNYRQGISVISAENLLIENTIMRNTAGTPPAAGIDFEPNHKSERLKNCVMRNCITENNQGDGYEFYLPNLHGSSEPATIEIINCRSVGDRTAVRLVTGNSETEAVKGFLRFDNCTFAAAQRQAVILASKPHYGMKFELKDCLVDHCGASSNTYVDIQFVNRARDDTPVGGVSLDNVTIRQPVKRDWLEWHNSSFQSETISNITGRVTVEQGGERSTLTLTPAWLQERFPPRFAVRVPRVKSDLSKARLVVTIEGTRKLTPVRLRNAGTFLFHASAGKEVVMIGRQTKVGHNAPSNKPLMVKSPDGKVVKKSALPANFGEPAEVRFTPAVDGFYTLEVEVTGNAFALHEANVPVAFDTSVRGINLISSHAALYAVVPQGSGIFAFGVAGEGNEERVKATVTDASGKAVWTHPSIAAMERFTATAEQGAVGGIWQISFARPTSGVFEDFCVELLGVPAYLFLDAGSYWTF